MIKEVKGRPTCSLCGYEWSAMMSDDEFPSSCACEIKTYKIVLKLLQNETLLSSEALDFIFELRKNNICDGSWHEFVFNNYHGTTGEEAIEAFRMEHPMLNSDEFSFTAIAVEVENGRR